MNPTEPRWTPLAGRHGPLDRHRRVVAIVFRVGINDDSGSAALLCDEGFHTAEVFSVADDDDLAADVDVHLFQLVEIAGEP